MMVALVHDHYDAKHLQDVKEYMMSAGAPKIRVVWIECYGLYAAIEGCHRLRAAYDLGITPDFDIVDYDTDITSLGLDCLNPGDALGDLVDNAHQRTILAFND
jgi:hypothetical protein